MTTIVQQGYDYSILDPRDATDIQQSAQVIRGMAENIGKSLIEIGTQLIAVKDRLPHGHFTPWLRAEFAWSPENARRYMRMAERFGKTDNMTALGNIQRSALYMLSSSTVDDDVVDEIMERAGNGEEITPAKAKEAINQRKVYAGVQIMHNDRLYEVVEGGTETVVVQGVAFNRNRTSYLGQRKHTLPVAECRPATTDDVSNAYYKDMLQGWLYREKEGKHLAIQRSMTVVSTSLKMLVGMVVELPEFISYDMPYGWSIQWTAPDETMHGICWIESHIMTTNDYPPAQVQDLMNEAHLMDDILHHELKDWKVYKDADEWVATLGNINRSAPTFAKLVEMIGTEAMDADPCDIAAEAAAEYEVEVEMDTACEFTNEPHRYTHNFTHDETVWYRGEIYKIQTLVGVDSVKIQCMYWHGNGTYTLDETSLVVPAGDCKQATQRDWEKAESKAKAQEIATIPQCRCGGGEAVLGGLCSACSEIETELELDGWDIQQLITGYHAIKGKTAIFGKHMPDLQGEVADWQESEKKKSIESIVQQCQRCGEKSDTPLCQACTNEDRIERRTKTLEDLLHLAAIANEVDRLARAKVRELLDTYGMQISDVYQPTYDDIADEAQDWCRSIVIAE